MVGTVVKGSSMQVREGFKRLFVSVALLIGSLGFILPTTGYADGVALFKPDQSKQGVDKALVFLGGGRVQASEYSDFIVDLQKRSSFRLWVALASFDFDLPNPPMANTLLDVAIRKLEVAGYSSRPIEQTVTLVGHSMGAISAFQVGQSRSVESVVLLGAYLPKGRNLSGLMITDFPRPILNVTGDLDGLSSWTRMVDDVLAVSELDIKSASFITRLPLIVQGINHSYIYNELVQTRDHLAEGDRKQSRAIVSRILDDFLLLNSPLSVVTEAQKLTSRSQLRSDWRKTVEITNPFLNAKERDSSLCAEAQWRILDGLQISKPLKVVSTFLSEGFSSARPGITQADDEWKIVIYQKDYFKSNPLEISSISGGYPQEILCKLKSREAILDALGEDAKLRSDFEEGFGCQSLNEQSILNSQFFMTPSQRRRYRILGKELLTIKDRTFKNGLIWSIRGVELIQGTDSVITRSPQLLTKVSAPLNLGGMQYCKFLPAQKAVAMMTDKLLPAVP